MANPGDLQFDRAEPAAAGAAPTSCTVCKQPLAGSYYAINGRAVCASCRDKVAAHAASGSFVTALMLGLGAATLGAVIWFGFISLTGYNWSLVAVVVGLLVGSAVRKGSRGLGGWKYQTLSIVLTYLSVVATDASISIRQTIRERGSRAESGAITTTPPAAPSASSSSGPVIVIDSSDAGASVNGQHSSLVAIVLLVGFALALPVLIGIQSPLSFVILAFALYQAWKLNKVPAFRIAGPFQIAAAT
jgi:hypothetical protein